MEEIKNNLPVRLFVTAEEWRQWLVTHNDTDGVWLRFYKKGHGESITHGIALDEALCHGWIDSQAARYDDDSFLQKFTPRRKGSIWSKRNIEHVERLIEEDRMTPLGLAEIENAKADGRWQQAYDSPSNMQIPQDFLVELAKHPAAHTFFETLNKTNLYSIAWRLQTAKTEATRQKRMQAIIAMLSDHKKFH
ncbi:MAG: YdeI/OmpD-associated family protein [Candidatus Saccharibacteria bacterium]